MIDEDRAGVVAVIGLVLAVLALGGLAIRRRGMGARPSRELLDIVRPSSVKLSERIAVPGEER
jgi:hypothetical protein